jgi:stalled ribosome alternative rescue factor ArfA
MELEIDLHSAKYRQRIEKTKKAKVNEQEEKEATEEIRRFEKGGEAE